MTTLTFVATGDSIITRRVSHLKDPDFHRSGRLDPGADAAFNNLELPLPRDPVVPNSSRALLCARPFVVDELAWMGLNLFEHRQQPLHRLYVPRPGGHHGGVSAARAGLRRRRRGPGQGPPAGLPGDQGAAASALVAAATPFSTTTWGGWATDSGPDCPGRPGINPLRYETRYVLDAGALRRAEGHRRGPGHRRHHRATSATLASFSTARPAPTPSWTAASTRARPPAVVTEPNKNDLEEIARWIRGARRQADLVVASLHAHEGPANDRNRAEVADFIVETAHAWIDAGADIFVGHGPHCCGPWRCTRASPSSIPWATLPS